MPEEQDSWFKAAFGVDLVSAAGKLKDEAVTAVGKVKDAVVTAAAAGAAAAATGAFPLGGSVGRKGKNVPGDVRAVQKALGIAADGECGPKTIAAIEAYQRKLGAAKPDGRVDAGGATERALARPAKPPPAESSAAVDSTVSITPSYNFEPAWPTELSGPGLSDKGNDLVDDLLQQQAALLQSLGNAGSAPEAEEIREELAGVGDEISMELSALKREEEIEAAEPRGAEEPANTETDESYNEDLNVEEHELTEPATSETEGAGNEDYGLLDEVVQGEFYEGETTWTGTAANVGVGVVPVVGQIADARDTVAAAKDLWDEPSWANAGNLGLAAVGWVPVAGDLAKGAVKVGRKAAVETGSEVIEETSQAADDVADASARLLDDDDIAKAFDDTEAGGFEHAGDMLQLGPHGAASRNRQEIGVSGKDVESGHLLPQAVGKKVVGYHADHALTRLLKKSAHASMDAPWKADFKAMRAAGKTTATAQEVFDTVANAIQKAPEIEPGEKMSLIAALTDEMFMQHGLKPDDLLDLPYPNIKAKSAK